MLPRVTDFFALLSVSLLVDISGLPGSGSPFNRILQYIHLIASSFAVVACVTMACALETYGLEDDWHRRSSWINDLEWANRHLEGLIIKVDRCFCEE